MDYGLILIIAAYLVGLQLTMRTNVNLLLATFVAVGVPYIVGRIIHWILIGTQDTSPLADLFTLSSVLVLALQFIVAFVVFKVIRDKDNFVAIAIWATGGFLGIVLLIPFVIQKII